MRNSALKKERINLPNYNDNGNVSKSNSSSKHNSLSPRGNLRSISLQLLDDKGAMDIFLNNNNIILFYIHVAFFPKVKKTNEV
jgi:hypothetical protein